MRHSLWRMGRGLTGMRPPLRLGPQTSRVPLASLPDVLTALAIWTNRETGSSKVVTLPGRS